MAEKRPHLFYTKAPEGTVKFVYAPRGGSKEKVVFTPKADLFVGSISRFNEKLAQRRVERLQVLEIPGEIISIEIEFYGWFDSADFELAYREQFGLSAIKYTELNKKVLFAIADQSGFENFLTELRKCIACKDHRNPDYNRNVKYIKSFEFNSRELIVKDFKSEKETVRLQLIDTVDMFAHYEKHVSVLISYLKSKNIDFRENQEVSEIELLNASKEIVDVISRNFDIVHRINSSKYRITRPSRYGTSIKEYPFKIEIASDKIPVMGIIDTGVSVATPLSSCVINNDNTYSIGGMNPRVDEAYDSDGHGTAVAAFAALGTQLRGDMKTVLYADTKILSIKVLQNEEGVISDKDVADLIVKANREHGIKFFVLTIGYSDNLKNGEAPSPYAALLDKLSFEHDIVIFISTGNNLDWNDKTIETDYPKHFEKENANICTPSDSHNNIVVGAIGDNLEPEIPITREKYPITSSVHPALYTRKFHLDYENLTTKNGQIIKPDVVYSGGNLLVMKDGYGQFLEDNGDAGIRYLSANPGIPFLRGMGTSFSAPLVANIAAKIIRKFPDLSPQTVKALIINSADDLSFGKKFQKFSAHHKRFIGGRGKPVVEQCLYSSENEATIIIQDKIEVGTVKSMPLLIPQYLNDAMRNQTLLGVEATICYRFPPVLNNQIGYCPINIAFGIFRNVPLEDNHTYQDRIGRARTKHKGISGGGNETLYLVNGWSQDGFFKSKMLSNTHKVSYYIKREHITNENNQFKIAVNCHFHKVLPEYVKEQLPKEYEYSLVIRLKDNQRTAQLNGQLYNELQKINALDILPDLKIETEADLDLDA